MQQTKAERLFSGSIGQEYDMLKVICPSAAKVSHKVGQALAEWAPGRSLDVFEIGCGTGITSLSLLTAREGMTLTAVDNEPDMLNQARHNLAEWVASGRLRLLEADALSALRNLAERSVDVVASGYAIHNFLQGYRAEVLKEIHRVLKPGGAFINGDRYALDDSLAHTRATQEEIKRWFKTFTDLGRQDLLEQWVVHLFSDESPDHIMRLGPSLEALKIAGFPSVEVIFREGVDTVLIAAKCISAD